MRRVPAFGFLMSVLVLSLACGGGNDGGNEPPPPPVVVSITPAQDTLTTGTSTQLAVTVSGTSNTQVNWSVAGGGLSGSVTAGGLYTAGTSTGTILVIAASQEDPSSTDTARVLVVAAPAGTITIPDSAAQGSVGLAASITSTPGATYEWGAIGGNVTSGQGTANIILTAGTGPTLAVHCTVRNLADSSLTLLGQTVLVAPPAIVSFLAVHDTVISGQATSITATFTGGTGAVDQGVGVMTSGQAVSVGPYTTGYAGTLLTLTVTGFRGSAATAQVRVVSVNPPVLGMFRAIGPRAPVGGRGQFIAGWNQDPGVVATISPGVGQITTAPKLTPVLTTPATTLYTLVVRAPGTDSAIQDTASVEAVLPASGQFASTGSMKRSRAGMSATRLLDGRVLLAGGRSVSGVSLSSAEIYDPSTGTFSLTDSMPSPRQGHAAELLADGRVLVAGGGNFGDPETGEFYDPATGTWAAGPPLQLRPIFSVRLTDQRVLLIPASGQAALYDPVGMTTTLTGALPATADEFYVAPLSGNRVLLANSSSHNLPDGSTWIFDAASGQFTPTGSMHAPHRSGTLIGLADGRVLIAGGVKNNPTSNEFIAKAEIFDPATGQWAETGKLSIPRVVPQLVLLSGGNVLVSGGLDEIGQEARYAEIFNPSSGQFTPMLSNIPELLIGSRPVLLTGGDVLFVGGDGVHEASGSAERFTP